MVTLLEIGKENKVFFLDVKFFWGWKYFKTFSEEHK